MKAIIFVLLAMVLVDCGSFYTDEQYIIGGMIAVLFIVLLMQVVASPSDEVDSDADLNKVPSVQSESGYGVARTLLSPEAGITVTFNADADR
jgi:hypothetical protein